MKSLMKLTAIVIGSTLIQFSAHAVGPSTGGGGHLSPIIPANAEDVARAVARSYQTLKYFLQGMEQNSFGKNDPRRSRATKSELEMKDLLFYNTGERKNALDELPKLEFDLRDDYRCIDKDQKPAAGSYTSGTKTLCFSMPMILAEKPTQLSVYEQAATLAAHELAHYMGADEPLALKVEAEFKAQFGKDLALKVEMMERHMTSDILHLRWNAIQIKKELAENEEFPEMCRTVDKMNTVFNSPEWQNPLVSSADVFRGQEQALYEGLRFRIAVLAVLCTKPKKYEAKDKDLLASFEDNRALPMDVFFKKLYPLAEYKVASRYLLSKPVYGDRAAMAKEINAIDATAVEITKNFGKSKADETRFLKQLYNQ